MRQMFLSILVGLSLTIPAIGQEMTSIENYGCKQFLSDAENPDNVEKFVKALITIAWGTGFAAAHQQNQLRADLEAMHSVAILAGDACRKNPQKPAVSAIADAIREIVESAKNQVPSN